MSRHRFCTASPTAFDHPIVTQAETEEPAPAPREIEPPTVGVGTAVRRHPLIIIICVVLLVAGGAAVGLRRKPVYTATARLEVGDLNLAAPGALSGYAAASQALAASYARAVTASAVVAPVARQMHLPQSAVTAELSATPVPLSATFDVTASSPTSSRAVRLANAASVALSKYVASLNSTSPASGRLLAQLRTASTKFETAKAKASGIARALTHSKSARLNNALVAAQAQVDATSANLDAVRTAYADSLQAETSTSRAQLLSPAVQATSDRVKKLEISLFVGLAAGLLLGIVLATLRARRVASRS